MTSFVVPRSLFVLALVVLSCTSNGTQGSAGVDGVRAERPTVTIVTPGQNEVLAQGNVDILVAVDAFLVVDRLGDEPRPGEGHLHFYKDVSPIPTDPGEPAVADRQDAYVAVAELRHTWTDIATGDHVFGVQLVQNDHTPLDPPIFEQVTVTVTDDTQAE